MSKRALGALGGGFGPRIGQHLHQNELQAVLGSGSSARNAVQALLISFASMRSHQEKGSDRHMPF